MKTRKLHTLRSAAKAPLWIRSASASKVTAKQAAGYKRRRLGKLGAASEVRHIDPVTGQVRA